MKSELENSSSSSSNTIKTLKDEIKKIKAEFTNIVDKHKSLDK